MLNINKIVGLVELSKETGANIDVNIHEFVGKKEALEFAEELFQLLNVEFVEDKAETVGWFATNINDCNITVFFKLEVVEHVG